MKIAKLSLDGYINYGNVLQNYALQEVLKVFSASVDTIWHTPNARFSSYWKMDKRNYAKLLLNHNGYRSKFNNGELFYECARQEKIYEFTQKHISIRYDVEDLKSISHEYDYFIIGSDQVWNPYSKDGISVQFLTFAPENKRISFSASMGSIELPSNKDEYIAGLNGMSYISVRENSAAAFLSNYTNKPISVVCDPTLLLPAEKWRTISKKPFWYQNEKYALLYFLGPTPSAVIDYCKTNNLKIVKLLDTDFLEYYFTSPEEWIFLFDNADTIFTDSFHGMCFSIQFTKKLFVFDRKGSGTFGNMNSRTKDLLSIFNLENDFKNNNMSFDLSLKSDEISDLRNKLYNSAISFLNNALC